MNAFWFWLQAVVAAVALILSGWAWVGVVAELQTWVFTFPQVITALFFLSGAALAMAVNTFLLARRKPRVVATWERVMIGALIALLALAVILGLFDELSWATLIVWPLIVIVAIISTVLIGVRNARTSQPVPPVPWETPAIPPAA